MSDTLTASPDPDLLALVHAARAEAATGTSVTVLVGDRSFVVPAELAEVMFAAVEIAGSGSHVEMSLVPDELTTGQAADLLGVSRPTVVALIDRGELPATRVGTRRRIAREDLLEFRKRSRQASAEGLSAIVAISQDLGLYDT